MLCNRPFCSTKAKTGSEFASSIPVFGGGGAAAPPCAAAPAHPPASNEDIPNSRLEFTPLQSILSPANRICFFDYQ
jgi:hypothetical protein